MAESLSRNKPIQSSSVGLNRRRIVSFAFWFMFALNYLYINRLLIVATNDKFRLGVVVIGLSLLTIAVLQKIVINTYLGIGIVLMVVLSLLSAWINQIPLLQLLAFLRIPLVVYLIYNVVWYFFDTKGRVEKVLRYMYIIAALQLPIIIIQRFSYPWLPERFKLSTSLVDFGMGTFSGDTSMAFALIGLVILLLYNHHVSSLIRSKWLIAAWLSLAVLFSNSQIQQITIVLVWITYLVSHLRLRTIIIGTILAVFVSSLLLILSFSGLMSFPELQSTAVKALKISQIFDENIDYDVFLSGGHARVAAISYYFNQPVKWIGDGPGSVYDTTTGQRTVGGWGHIYTFYAEVGLIGLILSFLIFLVIAFPVYISDSIFRLRASWVGALMFLAILIVAFIKYPMGDSAMVFTYCLILIGNFRLNVVKPGTSALLGKYLSFPSKV